MQIVGQKAGNDEFVKQIVAGVTERLLKLFVVRDDRIKLVGK